MERRDRAALVEVRHGKNVAAAPAMVNRRFASAKS
jgi:hypothetical protein